MKYRVAVKFKRKYLKDQTLHSGYLARDDYGCPILLSDDDNYSRAFIYKFDSLKDACDMWDECKNHLRDVTIYNVDVVVLRQEIKLHLSGGNKENEDNEKL